MTDLPDYNNPLTCLMDQTEETHQLIQPGFKSPNENFLVDAMDSFGDPMQQYSYSQPTAAPSNDQPNASMNFEADMCPELPLLSEATEPCSDKHLEGSTSEEVDPASPEEHVEEPVPG